MSDPVDPVDYNSMSDEEFLQQAAPPIAEAEEGKEKDYIEGRAPDVEASLNMDLDDNNDVDVDVDPIIEEDEEGDPDDEPKVELDDNGEPLDEEGEPGDKAPKATVTDKGELLYKAMMDEITAPFKANGGEMQVSTPSEIRTLMQQGANYTKKMQTLKPHLKFIKKLGNNELLDESKLDYLIDLSKGNPEAISKLLKDSNIDPLTLDTDRTDQYKPSTYTVADSEIELEATLEDLRDSASIIQTLEIVNNKWDEESRKAIAKEPTNLKIINEHVEAGVYPVVMSEVNKQRALGNIGRNVSDIAAYQQVGENLRNSGALDKFFKTETPAAKVAKVKPAGKNSEDAEAVRLARKAAAKAPSNKAAIVNKGAKTTKAIWEMSDAEFDEASKNGTLL